MIRKRYWGPNDEPFLHKDGNHGWWSFGSNHVNGLINCCWGDGSVRKIANTIDFPTFLALSGINDGVVVTVE